MTLWKTNNQSLKVFTIQYESNVTTPKVKFELSISSLTHAFVELLLITNMTFISDLNIKVGIKMGFDFKQEFIPMVLIGQNAILRLHTLGIFIMIVLLVISQEEFTPFFHILLLLAGVCYIEGLKHNLLSIVQLMQKGYIVYMEDNHYVIEDIHPRNQLIAKVPMTSNHLFPLRIVPDNTRVSFKEESKEEFVHCDKK